MESDRAQGRSPAPNIYPGNPPGSSEIVFLWCVSDQVGLDWKWATVRKFINFEKKMLELS